MNRLRALIVEDAEDDALLLERELRRGGYDLTFQRVDTAPAMEAALRDAAWDIVFSDYGMPQFSAEAALTLVHQAELDLPFIIISGSITEEAAVSTLKAGAHDFVSKGNLARLLPAVERELREATGRREHRRVEEQLRQSQKMEALGQLAGGVAHDFNNMLAVIGGYADVLLTSHGGDPTANGPLTAISDACDRCKSLTRQLLAFSRKQVVDPRVLNLNDVLADIQKMLGRLIGEDIDLQLDPAPDLPAIEMDPGQLEQILLNLAVNARDAMPQGGILRIATARSVLTTTSPLEQAANKPAVMLSVSDTGAGIDEAIRDRIFEPFFTTKPAGSGTGLGLATVLALVEQNGGAVSVRSTAGEGACFTVTLPTVAGVAEKPGPPPASARPEARQATILVVEDENTVRKLVRTLLKSQGHRVLDAGSAAEALSISDEFAEPIDLLLTDVVMLETSGRELAEQLTIRRPGLRVLYMSGYLDDAILRHGVKVHEVSFLHKPFSHAELASKVSEALASDS